MRRINFAYYNIPNMGDLLNGLLMERIFQAPYKNVKNVRQYELTGIGSFLDNLFEGQKANTIKGKVSSFAYHHCLNTCSVWGTGFITDVSRKRTGLRRNNVEFMAVRGRLTRECIEKILGCKIQVKYGDGGILAPYLLENTPQKRYEIGIIPHFKEKNAIGVGIIQSVYPNAHIIDLQLDPIQVIKDIGMCEFIISSSLHGLIVADSFNIPNVRIHLTDAPMGDGFKYDDYYSAFNITNKAIQITTVEDVPTINDIVDKYQVTSGMVNTMKEDMFNTMKEYIRKRM